jgi:CTP:molybdopterin cytidylyltransferase MocA
VVIGREYVPDLMRLEGDRGAGQWLKSRQQDVTVVSMPEASIDVDTVDDLHQLENDVRVSPTRSHGFS